MKRNGKWGKILVGVMIAVVTALLSWGAWVSNSSFAVSDMKVRIIENVRAIEQETKARAQQIEKQIDKQEENAKARAQQIEKRIEKQDKRLEEFGRIQNEMYKILMDLHKGWYG